jgi:hypothetical protein
MCAPVQGPALGVLLYYCHLEILVCFFLVALGFELRA